MVECATLINFTSSNRRANRATGRARTGEQTASDRSEPIYRTSRPGNPGCNLLANVANWLRREINASSAGSILAPTEVGESSDTLLPLLDLPDAALKKLMRAFRIADSRLRNNGGSGRPLSHPAIAGSASRPFSYDLRFRSLNEGDLIVSSSGGSWIFRPHLTGFQIRQW